MDSDNEERLQSSEVEGKNALKGRIWEESKKTLRIAFPTMLFRVASFGMAVVTQLFVGHFGQIELAAYALIQTILVLFVSGVLVLREVGLFVQWFELMEWKASSDQS
ncbi:Protein detoxification 25 [Vitis vinifera]|uniref:Protein detoxification 25 n=1 Tax=Vitis vinifera TaxID=29760 RepID=A0A438HZD2_VITVI|nr:Protein detoxification 25 [Vitis vinifera]